MPDKAPFLQKARNYAPFISQTLSNTFCDCMVLWVGNRNENNVPALKEHGVYGGMSSGTMTIKADKHTGCGS